jgi:hypothetical protein
MEYRVDSVRAQESLQAVEVANIPIRNLDVWTARDVVPIAR